VLEPVKGPARYLYPDGKAVAVPLPDVAEWRDRHLAAAQKSADNARAHTARMESARARRPIDPNVARDVAGARVALANAETRLEGAADVAAALLGAYETTPFETSLPEDLQTWVPKHVYAWDDPHPRQWRCVHVARESAIIAYRKASDAAYVVAVERLTARDVRNALIDRETAASKPLIRPVAGRPAIVATLPRVARKAS
jgi:hypothetical protein